MKEIFNNSFKFTDSKNNVHESNFSIFYNKQEDSARIKIEGDIGIPEWWQFEDADKKASTRDGLDKRIAAVNALEASKVYIDIDSFGGSVHEGIAMGNAISKLKGETIGTYVGYSASIATVIMQHCDVRTCDQNVNTLVHEIRGMAVGLQSDIENAAKEFEMMNSQIAEVYATRSGKTVEFFRNLMSEVRGEGRWLTPEEAKEYGLIDEINETISVKEPEGLQMAASMYGFNSKINNKMSETAKKSWLESFKAKFGLAEETKSEEKKAEEVKEVTETEKLNARMDSLEQENKDLREGLEYAVENLKAMHSVGNIPQEQASFRSEKVEETKKEENRFARFKEGEEK